MSRAMPPLEGTTNTCVRFRSVQLTQCLKRSRSVTWAFTLLDSALSSSALLQSSVLQLGYTSDEKAIHFPSGDHTGWPAPLERVVTCVRPLPSGFIAQICPPFVKARSL